MTGADYLAEHEPRRLALLVGNARYEHLAALPGVLLDVDLMQAQLAALDFQVTRCVNVASVAQFEDDVLPAFRKQIRAGDLVAFYFSGHGFAHGAGQYLALGDTNLRVDAQHLADVAIAVDSLQDYLSRPSPGLLLLVVDACRGIAGVSINVDDHSNQSLKGGPPVGTSRAAGVNLLSAYASRSGMPAIASDDVRSDVRASLFTSELVVQLGEDDREFGAMFNEVSARVRQASGERQQPGLLDWSDTDLYLRLPPALREQQKEAWHVALASSSRMLVQRFAYRFSISRHAAAARAWLADHPPARTLFDGLRSGLAGSAAHGPVKPLLLELLVPPLPDGLPELLQRSLVDAALSDLRRKGRRIHTVSLATASCDDPDEAELRESRMQHAYFTLEQAGIERDRVSAARAPVGSGVRFRFYGDLD